MGLMTEASPTLKVSHNALFYTLLVYAVVGRRKSIEMIPLGMIQRCLLSVFQLIDFVSIS